MPYKKSHGKRRLPKRARTSVSRPFQAGRAAIRNKIGKHDRINSQGHMLQNVRNPVMDRGPLPTAFFTKLRYVEKFTLYPEAVSGMLNGAEVEICLNSLFDPNQSGTGHQPYCFDQIAALYKKYLVYGCTVQITASNSSDKNNAITYLVRGAYSTTTLSGLDTFTCQERYGCGAIYTTTAGDQHVTANLGYISMPDVCGETYNNYMGNHRNATYVTNNPDNRVMLLIACSNMAAITSQVVDITVTLVFHAKFYDRAYPGQS